MISVVLATHNEEKNIERCLEAVKGFADEIIVVDGESEDKTVELAKKFGAKVTATTNKANFHINKQQAMDLATGVLILQLDADEVVDEELAQCIQEIHRQVVKPSESTTLPAAWWIKRKNWFLGKFLTKGGQYPDPVIRLYQKGLAKLPQKDVHEQMVVKGEVGWASGHLLHYGNPSFSEYLRKFNTYTTFKSLQLKEAHTRITLGSALHHLVWKPISTFLLIFFRHKGMFDGAAGFVFAIFSGLHHAVAYVKLWESYERDHHLS